MKWGDAVKLAEARIRQARAQYGIATSHFYWIGAIPAMVFVGIFMMPFYYGSRARSVPARHSALVAPVARRGRVGSSPSSERLLEGELR